MIKAGHARLVPVMFLTLCGATAATAAATSGTITVASSTITVAQKAGAVSVKVLRSGGSAVAASAAFRTHTGTAVVGKNYTGESGVVKWNAGDASAKTIAVALVGAAFTGTKTFTVALYDTHGALLGSPATATINVTGSTATTPPVTPPATPPVTPPVTPPTAASGPAAKLAAKLGRPARLLVGLGTQGDSVDVISTVMSQAAKVDIYERYLGLGDWTTWDSAPCDYVCVVADAADSIGAIPMYTQYQMANNGDGNLASVNDSAFMQTYWARVRILFQDLGVYNKPALVNLEPDFWGYVERQAPNGDPTKMPAIVTTNADCSTQPNNVTGIAGCLITMARKYAPKAYVGFPPSNWGGDTTADVVAFMNAVGAQKADFVVEQTLDRDSGCFEVSPQPSWCSRTGTGWYWDESNQTHPNFTDHLTEAKAYHTGIGNLPLIWWQTPEGVPSTTRGGTAYHYRDDRMHYFLTHPADLVAAGGLGVVFSTGEDHQTNITTDAGQFQSLDSAYFATPAKLP
jgi:hypothetical protein